MLQKERTREVNTFNDNDMPDISLLLLAGIAWWAIDFIARTIKEDELAKVSPK